MGVDDLVGDSVLNDDFVGPRSPWWEIGRAHV